MRIRALVAAGVVLAVLAGLAGPAAQAKTKPKPPPPLCNLVVSPVGDTPSLLSNRNGVLVDVLTATHQTLPYKTPPGYDPALDLVSADIASNATTITVVFRLAKLGGPDTTAPFGRYYSFSWAWGSSGVGASIAARITPQGNSFGPGTGATGVVDVAHNQIRVSQPIGSMVGHPLMPPGERMVDLDVQTDLANPALAAGTTFSLAGEDATSTKAYPHRAASCVKVGA